MRSAWLVAIAALLASACRRDEPSRGEALASSNLSASAIGVMNAAPAPPSAMTEASWPAFPTSTVAARTLVAAKTQRGTRARLAELDRDEIDRRLRTAVALDRAVAGEGIDWTIDFYAQIAALANRPLYLLFGTHHDAPAQVEAFRRLTGPRAAVPWTLVAAEQLRADGHWAGIASDVQRGDDDALQLYRNTGSRQALAVLAASQAREDYAAWKFNYVDSIAGIAADGYASGSRVAACDMPIALQSTLGDARAEYGSTLRELHCALAIEGALAAQQAEAVREARPSRGPESVAILWGASHVGPDGFDRFLPRDALVLAVRAVGGRPVTAPETGIADHFDVVDPVLVFEPSEGDGRFADGMLVLPDPSAERHFERKRMKASAEAEAGVSISSPGSIEIRIDGHTIAVGPKPLFRVLDPARPHLLAVPRGNKRTLLASISVPKGGLAELRLETTEPEVTVVVHTP